MTTTNKKPATTSTRHKIANYLAGIRPGTPVSSASRVSALIATREAIGTLAHQLRDLDDDGDLLLAMARVDDLISAALEKAAPEEEADGEFDADEDEQGDDYDDEDEPDDDRIVEDDADDDSPPLRIAAGGDEYDD